MSGGFSKDGSLEKKDGFLQDPYASVNAASSTSADISKLGPAFGSSWGVGAPTPGAQTPDFLFPETADSQYRRSWGDRLTYHIGMGYLIGAPRPRPRAPRRVRSGCARRAGCLLAVVLAC